MVAEKTIALFWKKVDVSPEPDACWLWKASKKPNGYGQFGVGAKYAHRVSWEIAHGSIPDEVQVLHRCNNKLCVRSSHLRLGSQLENMQDWVKAGCPGRRLTRNQVNEIRELRHKGLTFVELAANYGVGRHNIGRICRNQAWRFR